MPKTYRNIITAITCTGLLLFGSCKKLVEVDPPVTNPVDATVFERNSTAAAVLTGIYSRMVQEGIVTGSQSISFLAGLSSDEFRNYSQNPMFIQFYTNSLTKTSIPFWGEAYQYIYTANAALEGLSKSSGVTAEMKQQLMGEAYFIRGFFYFYLTNLFGDVPLHLVTDYRVTSAASRAATSQVYQQIISDLKEAQQMLTWDYRSADNKTSSERARPNRAAATALLSRVYLYVKDYANAEGEATKLINDVAAYSLPSNLNEVFLMNSTEAIWQLSPANPQFNTFDAYYFILTAAPGFLQPLTISTNLLNGFEENDRRFSDWVNSFEDNGETYYYPYKYKVGAQNQPVTEYLMVLRLAEQYLIRAEAKAQQGNVTGALQDLDVIRNRAGLNNSTASDKTTLLRAIEHERLIELFSEWGHRWLDLKRTGRADEVMSAVTTQKGGAWNSNWQLYPIPLNEIQNNPKISQNPGY